MLKNGVYVCVSALAFLRIKLLTDQKSTKWKI